MRESSDFLNNGNIDISNIIHLSTYNGNRIYFKLHHGWLIYKINGNFLPNIVFWTVDLSQFVRIIY